VGKDAEYIANHIASRRGVQEVKFSTRMPEEIVLRSKEQLKNETEREAKSFNFNVQ
jgi:hypothetical protein